MALTNPGCRDTDCQAFQGAAHLEDFVQLIDVQAADNRPAIGSQGHQALGIQTAKGFAHRHPAHADLVGDVLGNQPVAFA
ncbi:hypothetical protein FQZ97_1268330 [compost metagenome]